MESNRQMTLITFVTQTPLEEVQRLLSPPNYHWPSWPVWDSNGYCRVRLYNPDPEFYREGLLQLFPDAITQENQHGPAGVVYTDAAPLPTWFDTSGYVAEHFMTAMNIESGSKNRFFVLRPKA